MSDNFMAMTDAVICWHGRREVIENARLGDPRVADRLDALAANGIKGVHLSFEPHVKKEKTDER